MTSSTKMLTSAEKNTAGSNVCSNSIKDISNKCQSEFGYKPIKNRENRVGANSPTPRPTQPPNNPPEVGLNEKKVNLGAILTQCEGTF